VGRTACIEPQCLYKGALELLPTTIQTSAQLCVISGFRREVDENCALLGYYAFLISIYNLDALKKEQNNLTITDAQTTGGNEKQTQFCMTAFKTSKPKVTETDSKYES
jgi:hypothetical protein